MASPELQRLLEAIYECETCEPAERLRWQATVDQLVDETLASTPGLSKEQFLNALRPRLRELRKARRQPPTLPPRA